MKITINDTYHITSGYGSSVILVGNMKTKDRKTGEVSLKERNIGYYSTVSQALEHFVRSAMNENDAEYDSLKEYIDQYEELTTYVGGLINGKDW